MANEKKKKEESACHCRRHKSCGSGLGRCPGGRNGNPLQCSCLENSMDRGAWWATVPGLAKTQTRLSYWHTHSPHYVFLGISSFISESFFPPEFFSSRVTSVLSFMSVSKILCSACRAEHSRVPCTLLSGQIGLIRILLVWLIASSLRGLPSHCYFFVPPANNYLLTFFRADPRYHLTNFYSWMWSHLSFRLVLHLSSSYFVHLWLFVSISYLLVHLCFLTVHTQRFKHIGTQSVRHITNHSSDIIHWKLLFF